MDKSAPVLTFPENVAKVVEANYTAASCVLEYGSGGSTALAASIDGLTCFSVESDRAWAANMTDWIAQNRPSSRTHIHYANIGATKAWGYPKNYAPSDMQKYRRYTRSVWQRDDFSAPDVVLIDGRFRVWCFLTVMARIKKPTRILFDDYKGRDTYKFVERYFEPIEMVGRMAVFEITRKPFRLRDMNADIEALVTQPR